MRIHQPGILPQPGAQIEKLRAAKPVVEVRFPLVREVWTTTTQDLANQVLRDSETFTLRTDGGDVAGLQWWMPRIVHHRGQHADDRRAGPRAPARHRRRGVRRRSVLEMQPRIMTLAGELADALFADGPPLPTASSTAMRASCRFR